MLNIFEIAKKLDISEKFVIPYGYDKAKIDLSIMDDIKHQNDGKLVLVTAITPTKAGEGKTTTSIALHDGLAKINKKSLLCLREPSLGPVFGLKGGATGGGKASIIPSESINLHFTGDIHALTSAVNLIAAVLDNYLFNNADKLKDKHVEVVWKRALDMNDRALRHVIVSNKLKGIEPREDQFMLTVATELMAIFCLSTSLEDLANKVNEIILAYIDEKPLRLKDLEISHAVTKLLKDAFNPNLVQTLEGNPVFVHGGPFANIAHGCSSLIATKLALKLSPIVITEAGFGADLGAEKFMDIKCRVGQLHPDAVVVVATIRALKMHGGQSLENLNNEDLNALQIGFANLKQHMENIAKFGVPAIVCINHFDSDTDNETKLLRDICEKENYKVAFCSSFANGSDGAIELATAVTDLLENNKSNFMPLYNINSSIEDKINTICKQIYRADDVVYSELAKSQIKTYTKLGYDKTPICIAKTPLSFSDDGKLLNAPKGFKITIREINLSAGANFLIPLSGSILTMPGLPKVPAAVLMEKEEI